MKLLLVEDERRLAETLALILKKNKYSVDLAFDGETGQDMAETAIYDLIILDRMLPVKDGVSVLKRLRSMKIKTPVIFLTAKDTVRDRVEGLDAGADDYLVKPFSTDELLARIRALGRRKTLELLEETLKVGKLVLNPLKSEITIDKMVTSLTMKETQLLELLMKNKGQVIPKERILEKIWGYDSDVTFSNVELYIYYLRKKIDSKRSDVNIKTIRGIGYCLLED